MGASIFQGVLNANSIYIHSTSLTLGYKPGEQRFDPSRPVLSLPIKTISTQDFASVLPFTLPLGRDFVYVMRQANLTIDRPNCAFLEIQPGIPVDSRIAPKSASGCESTDPKLLTQNYANCLDSGYYTLLVKPLGVSVPSSPKAPTATTCGYGRARWGGILGVLGGCPAAYPLSNGAFVSTPSRSTFPASGRILPLETTAYAGWFSWRVPPDTQQLRGSSGLSTAWMHSSPMAIL